MALQIILLWQGNNSIKCRQLVLISQPSRLKVALLKPSLEFSGKSTSVLDLVTLLPFSMFCTNCLPRVTMYPGQREEQEREHILLQEESEEDSLHHPASGQVPELLLDCVVSGWPQHVVCSHCALRPTGLAHLCPMWGPTDVYILNYCYVNHYTYVTIYLNYYVVFLYTHIDICCQWH